MGNKSYEMEKQKTIKVTKENYKEVARKCVELTLKLGRPVYFNIAYWDTPIAPLEKEDKRQWCVFPIDYEKLLVLLLSHPQVSEIHLDEKEGAIKLVFSVPDEFAEEGWEEW
ncbi:MAG: hypothetical protein JRC86_01480 [Deltaproteobacteria bacterium]|nr:hypothetical protein [Deltaproteobacteria bacterium]